MKLFKLYDKNMRFSDEFGAYLTVVEMTTLTVAMTCVLVWSFKKKVYNFMKVLIFLCIIANIGTAMLSVGLALETDSTFHINHTEPLAHLIGWNTFFFNAPTNVMHWLFGYKYWVISVEVPRALSGENKIGDSRWRERFYVILNVTMITVNLVFCVWVSFARYWLSVESAGQPAPNSRVNEVSDLYHVVTFLLLFSALFLADALRRIRKTFTTNPHLI